MLPEPIWKNDISQIRNSPLISQREGCKLIDFFHLSHSLNSQREGP